jgi:hypothetical protein
MYTSCCISDGRRIESVAGKRERIPRGKLNGFNFCYEVGVYTKYVPDIILFSPALQPSAGYGLFVHEVS